MMKRFVWICSIFQTIFSLIDGKSFEYELPNRTVTICPTYSLISLECPQIPLSSDVQIWQSNLPRYLISIDHIRSFPILQTNDVNSCQPDQRHPCFNYDLRYLNTLCNGKAHCSDIQTYQIRDRSHCAFKAVTEIGYHCVPTWHLNEIQTKCDICKNGSLTNDYGFIYSRNFPLKTIRSSCFTTIYARPNHKTILYFVNGQLNYDQLRIESVTAEGLAILNITLNGNLTTQRLGSSTYETKITFTPSHIYSSYPTYFLLYFYTIPICSITEPCLTPPTTTTTTTTTTPYFPPITMTTRSRIQSVGWTRIPNVWMIIPIVLGYVLLLLLIIILALCLQRRRKQQKRLENLQKLPFPVRYIDNSGTSSRAHLVNPYSPSAPPISSAPFGSTPESLSHLYGSQTLHYPQTFAQNAERFHRESRSDFNLHENPTNSIDYRSRTFDYPFYNDDFSRRARQRRSLPKSFSDCDLCKRRVLNEDFEMNSIDGEQNENFSWKNSPRHVRPYREKLKERVRERLTIRNLGEDERFSSCLTSTLPHSTRMTTSSQQLPFEYIPNDSTNPVRTVEYQRNGTNERFSVDNRRSKYSMNENDDGTTNFSVKFYPTDQTNPTDPRKDYHERSFNDAKEVQEMSMKMNEQIPYSNRYSYSQHQRCFNSNNSHC